MQQRARAIGAAMILALAAAACAQQPSSATTCLRNGDAPEAERAQIARASLEFLEQLARDPAGASAKMSRQAREAATPEKLALAASQLAEEQFPPRLEDVILLSAKSAGAAQKPARAACKGPDGIDFIAVGTAAREAHLVVRFPAQGSYERTATLWLEQAGGDWRVQSAHVGVSALGGKGPDALWREAQAQRAKGHSFNAAMLYSVAQRTSYRGDALQPAIVAALEKDFAGFAAPVPMSGPPPYAWRLAGRPHDVLEFTYLANATGKPSLLLRQPWAPDAAPQTAEAANRALIEDFRAAFPEWREVFGAVIAQSTKPANEAGEIHNWGTVYRDGVGYVSALAAAPGPAPGG